MTGQTKSPKVTRGDSFKQKKGDLYQFAMAVKICLEAKAGERIQIEHKGDISSEKLYSYEIKQYETNFTFQCDQFWNTLYNWIVDFDCFQSFSKLIILTTSDASDSECVARWNTSNKEEKYHIIKCLEPQIRSRINVSKAKIKALDTILSYDKNYTKKDLLTILDKITVIIGAPKSSEINSCLSNLECFKHDSVAVRKRLINAAKAFVIDVGIDRDEWVIETSELHELLRKLKDDKKYKLKDVDELDANELQNYHEYRFVREIKKINIDGEPIDDAIQNYFIASEQINDIISEFPNLLVYQNSLDIFSKDLLRNLKNIKQLSISESRNEVSNYYRSQQINLKQLELIENNERFQLGNIHKIVDEIKHNWKYENK